MDGDPGEKGRMPIASIASAPRLGACASSSTSRASAA
jgi:hypothetical protein